MLKEIKKIHLEKINLELKKYETLKKKIEEIRSDLYVCKLNIDALEKEKYSFLDKYLLKRKLFNETKLKINNYHTLYNKLLLELQKKTEEIETIPIEELRTKTKKITEATTLKDLNLNLTEAIKLLEEHKIEFILNESDKEITLNDSTFQKTSDYILVHKADHIPSNNRISTPLEANGYKTFSKTLKDGTIFKFDAKIFRNTIHFTLNGEVSSHEYGNFDNRKYAILIPFDKVNTNNMLSFSPEDTYFYNGINIENGYILCPITELELVKKNNPNTSVIGYTGNNVDGYANALLSLLGYKYKEIGKHSWVNSSPMIGYDDDDIKNYRTFKNNNNFKTETHYGSLYSNLENKLAEFYIIIEFTKRIKDYIENNEIIDEDAFICEIYPLFRDNSSINFIKDEKISLKDYIDTTYTNEENDNKESNLALLLYELKNNFGIELKKETISLLKKPNDKILSKKLNELIELCNKDEKTIYSIYDIQKLILIHDITHQLLLEKEKNLSTNTTKKR